jgi:D-beta-D-heptose 7-phosphate kinase/D-beta-D-heptose 1-phosphate adenosyltransferase
MSKNIVLVTGGFDPIHSGHIAYFLAAKQLGDELIVGLNSDEWLIRKKGKFFMNYDERYSVVSALKPVSSAFNFNDEDNTAIDAIRKALTDFPNDHIIFANGGDRGKDNIPEMAFESDRVSFSFGIGGDDKKNSSSWILKNWEQK